MNFVLTILILAIVIATSAFGLNQIMLMQQDVKYIRSHIKLMVAEKTKEPVGTPTAVTPVTPVIDQEQVGTK